MVSIVQFTTVHPRGDTRIRVKEVTTLARAYGSVTLLVQDGKGDAVEDDGKVKIVDVGAPGGRLIRAGRGNVRMLRRIIKLRPKVIHFHDPELLPLGLLLKLFGFKVIYDVHEDVPKQIMDKYWLPKFIRWPVARTMKGIEWVSERILDNIVAAEPIVAESFSGSRTVIVQNFPLLSEFERPNKIAYSDRPRHFAYIGGISRLRGALDMIDALECFEAREAVRLSLAGPMQPPELLQEAEKRAGWAEVNYFGWANRSQLTEMLEHARAGLVVLHPIGNYLEAYPVKMFEYMAAEVPVIASDFPLWRRIVEDAECGLLVRPQDPSALADAMKWILNNPKEAEEMGRRGRQAVETRYSWDSEAKKLLSIYERLLSSSQ